MTESDYKKAKRNVIVSACVMAAVFLVILGIFLRFTFKRDNPALSAQALVQNLEQAQTLCWKLEDVQYTLPASEDVTSLFEGLEPTRNRPREEQWITLHFGELYEFYIYESGLVVGFDGYAATATETSSYYLADSGIYEQLKLQILANGREYDGNLGFFK